MDMIPVMNNLLRHAPSRCPLLTKARPSKFYSSKEDRSMFTVARTVFVSAVFLALVVSGWAAEEKQPPGKAEKGAMEKKPEPMEKSEMGKAATGNKDTMAVQEALKAKGNDPGPIDGRMGPKTREALKSFQESNKLKATGRLDKETAEKLGVSTAAASGESKAMKREKAEPMGKEPMGKEPMGKEPMGKDKK
jgi:hypothetical protein